MINRLVALNAYVSNLSQRVILKCANNTDLYVGRKVNSTRFWKICTFASIEKYALMMFILFDKSDSLSHYNYDTTKSY